MQRRITSTILTLAIALAGLVVMTFATATAAQAADLDCGDFSSQAAAQANLNANPSDPNGLDSEGDGVACESNPCPCSTSSAPPASTPTVTAPKTNNSSRSNGNSSRGQDRKSRVIQDAIVTRVVDGDTVKVRLARGGRETVRILGIDTPEVSGGTECYGPEAEDFAERKLPRGTRVTLTSDPTQDYEDRYGRILRYLVKKSNGRDFGKQQLARGNAEVYVYRNNPFEKTSKYRRTEASAQDAARGMWGAC